MQKKKVVKREMAVKQTRPRQMVRLKMDIKVKNHNGDVVEDITNTEIKDNNSMIELESTKPSKKTRKTREIENNEINEESNE